MVFQDVESSSPIKGDALRPGANVVGTAITASMLGIDPGSVNGELPDAIGELTNMIADEMGLAIDPDISIARIARVIAKDQVLWRAGTRADGPLRLAPPIWRG